MIKQLIVGMPGSGKSTFIAALRHLLLAAEVPTELELVGLSEEELHLNRLESSWLKCTRLERTRPATEAWVDFCVRDQISGIEATISVPDLRGEAFEQPACIGKCQKSLHDALMEADSILLFTNADKEDDSLLISDLADIIDSFEAIGSDAVESFRPESMPEEVKIVEFLQMANRRPRRSKRRKVAVLVSAWDVIKDDELDPINWFQEHRPMVSQFLEHNEELWSMRVYGVSAQGGRLPQDKEALSQVAKPSERIRIVGYESSIHDLTAPVRWLMAKDN